ncbi:MAG: hypothetical protein VB086_09380 [Clostridiaceae bacterium]|nr:hypothetical protein [Clostridiaceae bacterium]
MNKDFGIYPDNMTPRCWWGARAIATNHKYGLDIPWDRQCYDGEKDDDFLFWINNTVIPKLDQRFKNCDTKIISFNSDSGRFHCEASDRNNYGYLYIGCWEV